MTEGRTHLDTVAVTSLIEVSPLQQATMCSVGAAVLVWAWAAGVVLVNRKASS